MKSQVLTLAADILEKSNGKDVYLKVAKELLQEARKKRKKAGPAFREQAKEALKQEECKG